MKQKKIYAELSRLLLEPGVQKLYQTVEAAFKAQDSFAHNWEHVRRDIVNSVEIGLEEGADMDIVMPAIILHDIGYVTHPQEPEQHPLNGSRECFRFLDAWTPEQRKRISSCILTHKGKFPGFEHSEPETMEEKVVCDADQVDKFGWIGFIQVIKVFVEHGTKGYDLYKTFPGMAEALKRRKSIILYTETGKRLAAERREPDFMDISEKLTRELSLYEEWKEPF